MRFIAKLNANLIDIPEIQFLGFIENSNHIPKTKLVGIGDMVPMGEIVDSIFLVGIYEFYNPESIPEEVLNLDWGVKRPDINRHWIDSDRINGMGFFLIMSHQGDKLFFCKDYSNKESYVYMGFSGSHEQLQEYIFKFKITLEAVEEVTLNQFKEPLAHDISGSLAIRLYEEGSPELITKIVRCAFMQPPDYIFKLYEQRVVEYYKQYIDRYKIEMLESLKEMMHASICSMK